MPRLQPPPGYLTASDAAKRLGVSDGLLTRYVNEGKLRRYGPPERKHKFYKLSEVESLREAERLFEPYIPGQWREHASSTFRTATEQDVPAIMEMNVRTYSPGGLPLRETWLAWLRANPESFHVLTNQAGDILGYSCVLVMSAATVDLFIRNRLPVDEIGPEQLETLRPGVLLHLYLMSVVVDPRYPRRDRVEYGSRLIHGLFAFFLDLAQQGIEIATITARSDTPDGIRMMRKMGFAQVKLPVPAPGKHLFVANVKESGLYVLEQYSELLEAWKRAHHKED